ncbi:MAG: dihydroneopterin aldolase [Acidobacteriota bacterium]
MLEGRVRVNGIRFHAFHGLTRLERQVGVRYRVDVELATDITAAAETDQIAHAIDYRDVHALVVEIGRGNSFHLIETLAVRIGRELLSRFPAHRVRVTVDKETPVLDGVVDTVGVAVDLPQRREEPSA